MSRSAGILLHPTALPGPFGCGDLGPAADVFIDWLEAAGQSAWQVLPLGPPALGDSPYSSLSAFAGNPLLISPELLVEDHLLEIAEIADRPEFPVTRADFANAALFKEKLLRRAFERRDRSALEPWRRAPEQSTWLEDWTLFSALRRRHGADWALWPADLARRLPTALATARQELADEIDFAAFVQQIFDRQWSRLRARARAAGIRLIGDVPIYVAYESADVWAHPELFDLDHDLRPRHVAGVPPDVYSATGQLWRNPLYLWERHAADGFRFWVERLRHDLSRADLVRLDHFRGLVGFWQVPGEALTAIDGRWMPGPGAALFAALRQALGALPLIAEDLGVITPDVDALRAALELPGTRVLHFGFEAEPNQHSPGHIESNNVVFTATHDCDTTRGFLDHLDDATRARVDATLGDVADPVRALVDLAYNSAAELALIPLQDILGLGSEARFNVPGIETGNWSWRLEGELSAKLAADLRARVRASGREVD